MKTTFIYVLIDPITNHVKYVGKTNFPTTRLKSHLKEVRNKRCRNQHKKAWFNNLISQNLKPIFEILDEVNYDQWEFWEQHYISLFRSWGFNLINKTLGGEGANAGIGLTEEHKNKITMANKGRVSNRKGAVISEEQKLKIGESLKAIYKNGKRKPVTHSDKSKQMMSLKQKENYILGKCSSKGEKNGMFGKTKEMYADGILFKSQEECANFYGIHPKTVAYRIRSKGFPSYYFKENLNKNIEHANVRTDKFDLSPAFPFKDFATRVRE